MRNVLLISPIHKHDWDLNTIANSFETRADTELFIATVDISDISQKLEEIAKSNHFETTVFIYTVILVATGSVLQKKMTTPIKTPTFQPNGDMSSIRNSQAPSLSDMIITASKIKIRATSITLTNLTMLSTKTLEKLIFRIISTTTIP